MTIPPPSEVIRSLRKHLPIPAGLRQHIEETTKASGYAAHQVTTAETLPLLLLDAGYPWPIRTIEDHARIARAGTRLRISPTTIATARLAFAFGQQYTVHSLHPTAIQTVRETDLHFWPTTPPHLLQRPLVVEADQKKGDGYLFGRVRGVCYMPTDSVGISLFLAWSDEGYAVDEVPVKWAKDDDEERKNIVLEASRDQTHVADEGGLFINSDAVLQFLTVLGLLFEAKTAGGVRPLDVETRAGKLPDGRPTKKGQGFTAKYVRLSESPRPAAPAASAPRGVPPHGEDLRPEEVRVRGFLRRQPCGPGGRDREVIFIDPHTALRWVSPERVVKVL